MLVLICSELSLMYTSRFYSNGKSQGGGKPISNHISGYIKKTPPHLKLTVIVDASEQQCQMESVVNLPQFYLLHQLEQPEPADENFMTKGKSMQAQN